MAIDVSAGLRRLRRRVRHLPGWSKVAVPVLCGVVAFFGIATALGATADRLEEPTPSLGTAVDDAAPAADAEASAAPTPSAEAAVVAPSALDAASGSGDVNLFDASGSQRTVDASEVPGVAAALDAFREAGYEAGFVVYDFATQRGLGCNADFECFSASTIKAPFVTYVAQALVDEGRAALTDEVFEDIVMDGTGIMATDDASTYDLQTVLTNTIVYSDNTGYALLRDDYGAGFDEWAAATGVDAAAWGGEWYPYYTPRDLAKLWLGVGKYLRSGSGQAALCEDLFAQTGTSFIRRALGADHQVLAKAGYEIDAPWYAIGALNDAGIVKPASGDYLMAVMSDADYDDEYFTDNEPLITNLIAALDEAHDRLLAA